MSNLSIFSLSLAFFPSKPTACISYLLFSFFFIGLLFVLQKTSTLSQDWPICPFPPPLAPSTRQVHYHAPSLWAGQSRFCGLPQRWAHVSLDGPTLPDLTPRLPFGDQPCRSHQKARKASGRKIGVWAIRSCWRIIDGLKVFGEARSKICMPVGETGVGREGVSALNRHDAVLKEAWYLLNYGIGNTDGLSGEYDMIYNHKMRRKLNGGNKWLNDCSVKQDMAKNMFLFSSRQNCNI